MKKLKILNIGATKCTDQGMKYLRGLTNLKWLILHQTALTDLGLACLDRLKSLESIDLMGTKVSPGGVEKLKSNLAQLKKVDTPFWD